MHVIQPSVSQKSFYNVQLHPCKKIVTIRLNALVLHNWKDFFEKMKWVIE